MDRYEWYSVSELGGAENPTQLTVINTKPAIKMKQQPRLWDTCSLIIEHILGLNYWLNELPFVLKTWVFEEGVFFLFCITNLSWLSSHSHTYMFLLDYSLFVPERVLSWNILVTTPDKLHFWITDLTPERSKAALKSQSVRPKHTD